MVCEVDVLVGWGSPLGFGVGLSYKEGSMNVILILSCVVAEGSHEKGATTNHLRKPADVNELYFVRDRRY
jgi:hypothetical protein